MKSLSQHLRALFSIDTRSLETFRIGLGLMLIFEVYTKTINLRDHYSDVGLYPRITAIEQMDPLQFSIHLINGTTLFQGLLFLIMLIAGFMVLIGYRAKMGLFVSWILILSHHARNPEILNAGDMLLRIMCFWALFLPIGQHYSLNYLMGRLSGRVQKDTKIPRDYAGMGSIAILYQLIAMYVFTAILKSHPIWTEEHSAVYYALSLEQFTTPVGQWLLEFPKVLALLTVATYWLEMVGPAFLFIPVLSPWMRLLIVPMFLGLHTSFFITMNIGMFPWICMVCWILYVPSLFWDFVERFFARPKWLQQLAVRWPQMPAMQDSYLNSRFAKGVAAGFVGLLLLLVTTWNVNTTRESKIRIPQSLANLVWGLRLDQRWDMFAPFPMKIDGWFVIPAKLKDGTVVNLASTLGKSDLSIGLDDSGEISWEKPKSMSDHLINTQWRKYFTNIWLFGKNEKLKLQFGKFLCRRWNRLESHPEEKTLMSYEIFVMKERTLPPDVYYALSPEERFHTALEKVEKVKLWTHDCFAP